MKNIVVLISGGGSNMAAIVNAAQQQRWQQHYGARVMAVVSNQPSAKGLEFARAQGIATEVLEHQPFPSREAFDTELAAVIDRYDPALWCWQGLCASSRPVSSTTTLGGW